MKISIIFFDKLHVICFKCGVCFISSSLIGRLVHHSECGVFLLWVIFLDCFNYCFQGDGRMVLQLYVFGYWDKE